MKQNGHATRAKARQELRDRLQARRPEIEEAVLTRVHAVSDASTVGEPEYGAGLRASVAVAIDYGIAAIERGEVRSLQLPATLLVQARLAARSGVGLETVLRRYFAGYTLLGVFLMEEADRVGLSGASMKQLLGMHASLFDRLVATVTEEYKREATHPLATLEERRAELVQKLLEGELVNTSELAYGFDGWHVGAIAEGPDAEEALRHLATDLDTRLLSIRRGESGAWGWFGTRHHLAPDVFTEALRETWPSEVALALGEPARGLAGWRLTHHQARAAVPIAVRSSDYFVWYADVALLAAVRQDSLLATYLRRRYLAPLESDRSDGEAARATLRAYFNAGRNASSAAATLKISRRTVSNRLHAIEERLGCSIDSTSAEIETALRLLDLDEIPSPTTQSG